MERHKNLLSVTLTIVIVSAAALTMQAGRLLSGPPSVLIVEEVRRTPVDALAVSSVVSDVVRARISYIDPQERSMMDGTSTTYTIVALDIVHRYKTTAPLVDGYVVGLMSHSRYEMESIDDEGFAKLNDISEAIVLHDPSPFFPTLNNAAQMLNTSTGKSYRPMKLFSWFTIKDSAVEVQGHRFTLEEAETIIENGVQ